ncbi:MAG: O-antigen ligase family protein [Rubricoccaceae bacterium]
MPAAADARSALPTALVLLGMAGLCALALALAAASSLPWLALALPLTLGGLLALGLVRAHPLAPLALALVLAGLALNRTAGIQPMEVVFGLYYLGYFAAWYTLRMLVYRERLVRGVGEGALAFFMLYMTAALFLTLLHGGNPGQGLREWIALSMLGFYFPVREACERYENGTRLVLLLIVYLGSVSLFRNVLHFQETIVAATYAWEVARARATSNELILMSAALASLALAAVSRRPAAFLLGVAGFAAFAVGVVLTQWRAYYVSLALGAAVVFALARGRERRRLGAGALLAVVASTGAAYLIAGDMLLLLAYGLLDRLLSIGTAGKVDISFLNRLLESRSLWPLVLANPIVGYGLGTDFAFFDVTTRTTWVKSYAHNGYLTMWYKFGVVGLGALLLFWGSAIARALRVRAQPNPWRRAAALLAAAVLLSLIPSFYVSAPFTTADTVIMFALMLGLAAGQPLRPALPPAPGAAMSGSATA